MIHVTRLGGRAIYLNSDLIESIESVPDTMVHLTTGNRVIVQESADEVVQRVVAFRRRVAAGTLHLVSPNDVAGEHRPPRSLPANVDMMDDDDDRAAPAPHDSAGRGGLMAVAAAPHPER